MVYVRVLYKRVLYHLVEGGGEIGHLHNIQSRRVDLEYPVLGYAGPAVSILGSDHISCVLRALLIVVCKCEICPRDYV